MRAYFKPRKVHPICLYLTADEPEQLLRLVGRDPGLIKRNTLRDIIPRIVGRAVEEMKGSVND
ncbi:hypothetical protein [Streptomyces albipurpureus]|uniref:Uncharacterized protein n=1 Tax=Streptomyces albipurpureus TaxID=2897419 RepID=A0ABT0UWM5_9ACTN|nr:hypothetical protein [Streptomyces sp. CWNU-1]MCM2391748.1 hypothetical protein [Streptomyces sp. CWNU-1]